MSPDRIVKPLAELTDLITEEQALRRKDLEERAKERRAQSRKNRLLAALLAFVLILLVVVAGLVIDNRRDADAREQDRCEASVESRTAIKGIDKQRGDSLVAVAVLLAGEDDPVTNALREENARLIAQFDRDLPTPVCP